jgi:hypothetical protein
MKKHFVVLAICVWVLFSGFASAQPNYCTPTMSVGCNDDYISTFVFGSLTNLTSNCSGNVNGYIQYQPSNYSAIVIQGQVIGYTVTTSGSYPEYIGIWIDYNNDGDFADIDEFITSSASREFSLTGNTSIPDKEGVTGTRRLRVRCSWDLPLSGLSSCTNGFYGETEDYSITIQPVEIYAGGTNDGYSNAPASFATSYSPNFNGSLADGYSLSNFNFQTLLTPNLAGSTGDGYHAGTTQFLTNYTGNFNGSTNDGYSLSTHSLLSDIHANFAGSTADGYSMDSTSVNLISFCIPSCSSGCNEYGGDYIDWVSLNTLSNQSSGCNGNSNSYIRYTPEQYTTTLEQGQSYPMHIQTGNLNAEFLAVWVDWNNDYDFDDVNELMTTTFSKQFDCTFSFQVPTGEGISGQKRMRVRCAYQLSFQPNGACSSAQWGETEDYTITIASPATKTLSMNILLEGLINGEGTMNKAKSGIGNQFPADIADKVAVSLHQSTSSYLEVVRFNDVNLQTNGNCTITVPGNYSGSYYIAIHHRNSIETWSAIPVQFSGSNINYNFSDNIYSAYGSNLKQQGAVFVIIAGDINQDGHVDGLDMATAASQASAFGNGYIAEDINGDGMIDALDMIVIDNNAAVFKSKIRP